MFGIVGGGGRGPAVIWAELVVVLCWCLAFCWSLGMTSHDGDNMRMRFIVTVNATWDPQNPDNFTGCLTTVSTPFLDSDRSVNETHPFSLGTCDGGALTFGLTGRPSHDGHSMTDIYLAYYSGHFSFNPYPTCYIPWNGTYLNPTPSQMDRSPLPSCFATGLAPDWKNKTVSHTIDYWFRVMDWVA